MNKMYIEYGIIVANLVVFVVAPFLPNIIYTGFVDTYVGAIILMIAALYAASYGYLATLSGFIGIASLFAESHARKTKLIKKEARIEKKGEYVKQLVPSTPVVPGEVHPEIPEPQESEPVTFMPKDDDGSNAFKAIDSTINTKVPLNTTSLAKEAENVYTSSNLAEKLD
jgi:hypothetical protein